MVLNLVNYSDSSSDEGDEKHEREPTRETSPKNKLPNPFEKPNKEDEDERDDASEHNGRARLFPHERGNWVTYIYIQCEKTDSISRLQDEILSLITSTNTLSTIKFHPIEELHMSLTRTVVLRHHWIDEFARSIQKSLKNSKRFWIYLDSIQIYCNDNKSRTFISLSLAKIDSNAKQNLQKIVNQLDSCLQEFKLPAFYKEASFHVSLLWCLGDKRDELQLLLPQILNILERLSSSEDNNFALNVERLFCKIGNKLLSFHL